MGVELKNPGADFVGAGLAHPLADRFGRGRVCAAAGVQRFRQRFFFEGVAFCRRQRSQLRAEAKLMGVLEDETERDAVERANLGGVEQGQLFGDALFCFGGGFQACQGFRIEALV